MGLLCVRIQIISIAGRRADAIIPGVGTVAVQLWSIDLDAVRRSDPLSADEQARAEAILPRRARARWMASRVALRLILARETGIDPDAIVLRPDARGKLALADDFFLEDGGRDGGGRRGGGEDFTAPDGGALGFSLSHRGGRALYAVSRGVDVGVDLELIDERAAGRRDEVAIAERVLGANAAGRLKGLKTRERHLAFLREWVAHEAYVKCLGVGLGAGVPPPGARAEVWVGEVDAGDEAVAALAVRSASAPEIVERVYEDL